MAWPRRFVNLFRSRRLNRDIEREMAFHLEESVDELIEGGLPEKEARREARRRLGNPGSLRERVREADVLTWLESLGGDVRYATRALRHNPAFTLVAVLSLALGIGANTAIFSLVNAVMLRPLPVPHPEELVRLEMDEGQHTFTNPLWEAIRDSGVLPQGLAFSDWQLDLTTGGVVRRASGTFVSGAYFEVLGLSAARGRLLGVADDRRGCPAAAVLSDAFWQREYGGRPDVVGRTLTLEAHPFEIVGVAEPGFAGLHVGSATDVFVPLCTADVLGSFPDMLDDRSMWFLDVFGRLAQDQDLARLQAGLDVARAGIFEATVPERWNAQGQREYRSRPLVALSAARGVSGVRGQYRQALLTLLVVVGVVLLIACANVAQLLLARATARRHEIAVRLAVGCGRARLVRQLLTESLLLALAGASLGVLFARWAAGLIVALLSQSGRSVSLDLTLDLRVLGFTVPLATATGLLFGLAPAWRAARTDPRTAASVGARGPVGEARPRFARGIVSWQVALSLVLLVCAGLLVTSFRRLVTLDPGFDAGGVLVASADWSGVDLAEERRAAFPRELVTRIRQVPGTVHTSAAILTPIHGMLWSEEVVAEGFEGREGDGVSFNGVSEGYFATLRQRLRRGRDFTERDGRTAAPVVIVNETLARRFFPGGDPLGRRLRKHPHGEPEPPMEIVGVVEDAKYQRLDEPIAPTAYVPLDQSEPFGSSVQLALRARGAPSGLVPAVVDAMREVHPGISLEFRTLSDQVAASLARPRLLAMLSAFFGGLALLLAVVGLYGTMAYDVARRRSEIGVRIALGARRAGILRMVAGEAGRTVAIGLALGGLLAFATTRWLSALLYDIGALDPTVLGLSALILALAAMSAGLIPAWRAAGVDPMRALREE